MIPGYFRALARLSVVQGAWNYERMNGVGMGYAAEPLLEDLKSADPGRHAEAMVRSAEYFNSHPYLAGLALGALARAEYDQVPGPQIARLRTALTSPLGALGDQVFWAGLVPAAVGIMILGAVAGFGLPVIVGTVALYALVRAGTAVWALRAGLRSGARVGTAIGASWLQPTATRAGYAAGLLVGAAVPLAADWLRPTLGYPAFAALVLTILAGLVGGWWLGPRITAVKFGVAAIGIALLLAWGLP